MIPSKIGRSWSIKDKKIFNMVLSGITFEYLRDRAKENERTLQAEIRFRLEKSIKEDK